MARKKWGRWGRGAAVTGSVLSLAVAGWLSWLLPLPRLAAVVGVGPVDGTLRVTRCYETSMADDSFQGFGCTGVYAPRTGGKPQRDMVLHEARREYRAGSVVEVRTVAGEAYELSGVAFVRWTLSTWGLFAPFLSLTIWLLVCARESGWAVGHGSIAFVFTLPLVAAVLFAIVAVVDVVMTWSG